MVVVMQEGATSDQIERVVSKLVDMGYDVHRSTGPARMVLVPVGGAPHGDPRLIEILDGVQEVFASMNPSAGKPGLQAAGHGDRTDDGRIGGDEVIVMAGPCSAENEQQVQAAAAAVKRAGAKVFRGGAFKPRSSPYAFQGLGEDGLRMLCDAARDHNLKLVSEVMDTSQIETVSRYADILQGRSRTIQHFSLLR